MRKWRPSYVRTFVVSVAVIAAVNVSLSIYLWSLPLVPVGKGGKLQKNPSDFSIAVMLLNFPGAGAVTLIAPDDPIEAKAQSTFLDFVGLSVSTLYWSGVIVAIDWLVTRRRKSRLSASATDAPTESDPQSVA